MCVVVVWALGPLPALKLQPCRTLTQASKHGRELCFDCNVVHTKLSSPDRRSGLSLRLPSLDSGAGEIGD